MTLQKKMTTKIDEFGGIEKLTLELNRLRVFATKKNLFDNMIFYFNSLYNQIVDVEGYAIEYRQSSLETIDFLEEFNKERKESTISFLIDLISFKLSSVAGIRKIS